MDLPDDLELPLTSGAGLWYWLAGRPALDFANTRRERWWRSVETLVTEEDLAAWLEAAGLLFGTGACPTPDKLLAARKLREAIDDGVEAAVAGVVVPEPTLASINAHLPDATLPRRLEAGPDGSARLVSVTSRDPIAHALGRIAADAAAMLGTEERTRVRICASETCSARFFDRSPAASRRWCSMSGCGNVAKARRHRRRAVS